MIQLRATPHLLHFKRPAATSRGALVDRRVWILAAHDDRAPDRTGHGEAGTVPALSIDDLRDYPARVDAFVEAFNAAAQPLPAPSWEPIADVTSLLAPFDDHLDALPSLRFAAECALLDLLQGGAGILFPSDFTRGQKALSTHGLVWMDSPAGLQAQVDAKVRAGFHVLKLKVGALAWQEELAFLRELRKRHPTVQLRLDANCAFPAASVLPRLEELAPLHIEYLEEPMRFSDPVRAQELCAASPVPIALDETLLRAVADWSMPELLGQIRPQHVILKPSLLGGFARTLDAIAICDQLGIRWWLNSLLESAVGHSAIVQFAALLERETARIHGLGTGSLFADNFASPIVLDGCLLRWQGAPKHVG